MSSLIFFTDPDQVLVITDTLVGDYESNPICFATKAHYLPHLRLVVACTGVSACLFAWIQFLNSGQVNPRGVAGLDVIAPDQLREMWRQAREYLDIPADKTATIYHFGLSEETGEMVAFAYRSTEDFRSDMLVHGLGVKPECTLPTEGDLLQHVRAMMEEQREIQSRVPPDKRVRIGGEAHALHLTKEGCRSWMLFRFDDYDEQMASAAAQSGIKRP